MKRQLSLVLALVMILGSFSAVFAAEMPTTQVDKANFLKEAKVLEGNLEGDLNLEQDLKRRDAVVVLSRLFGKEDVAKAYPSEDLTFTDLTDEFYNGYIAWAVEEGYAKGKVEGVTFGPKDPLTAQHFSTFLLRALGYEVDAKADYDKALETAKGLGLLTDLELEEKDTVTRGDMAAMTFNALLVKVKGGDKTLAETLDIVMPEADKATELTAKVLDTENLAEIVVELSNVDLVKNKEALTNPLNYRLSDSNVKVYNAELEGDNVVLTLVPYGRTDEVVSTPALVKDKKYDLTIRNIDIKVDKTYKNFVAKDNSIPSIEEVIFMGTHGIKVITSEPINTPQERDFRIGDKRTSMIVEQYGREIILTPYHSASFDKDSTELVIEELKDFANYKSIKTTEEMELVEDTTTPQVLEAYRSGKKLTLVFDQDVYHDSIDHNRSRKVFGNVSFIERRVTVYAQTSKKIDTNVVEYTFEREIAKDTEVLVEGVQNHSKETMENQSIMTKLYVDEYAPEVISDLVTSVRTKVTQEKGSDLVGETTKLTVEFSKDIQEFVDHINGVKSVNVADFFRLYELEVANRNELIIKDNTDIIVTAYDIKKDSISLTFTNTAAKNMKINTNRRDFDYVLEVRDFTDLSGNRMSREYIDFQVLQTATAFDVVGISMRNNPIYNRTDTEVRIVLSGYVDQASASDATNYYLNGKIVFDEAIVENDGVTVTLVKRNMNTTKFAETYGEDANDNPILMQLEISPRVKNLAKNAQVANRYWELNNLNGKVSAMESTIAGLPLAKDLTTADIANINAAISQYGQLTGPEKGLIDATLAKKYNAIVAKLDELVAADGALTTAKGLLQTAINGVTQFTDVQMTPNSLIIANAFLDDAVIDAQAAHDAANATVDSIEAATTALGDAIIAAQAKLVKLHAFKAKDVLANATVDSKSIPWNTDDTTTLNDAIAAVKSELDLLVTDATLAVTFDSAPTVTAAGLAADDYVFNVAITGTDTSTAATTVTVEVIFVP